MTYPHAPSTLDLAGLADRVLAATQAAVVRADPSIEAVALRSEPLRRSATLLPAAVVRGGVAGSVSATDADLLDEPLFAATHEFGMTELDLSTSLGAAVAARLVARARDEALSRNPFYRKESRP